jgi:recombination protein RecA
VNTRLKPAPPLNDPTDGPDGFLSTGSLALDLALGGGWPRGRVVEVYGPPGGGKTTLLLSAIAQAQRDGGMGALIDADHATNQATASRLGIDLERMPHHRTNCMEEAFERIEELAKSGSVRVIALDSVASLLPKSHLDGAAEPFSHHQDQGTQFRIDLFLRAMLGLLARHGTVLLVSNQVRERVGVMYGSPEMTPWVTMPVHDLASVRVRVERKGWLRDGETTIGAECRLKILKSRLAAPMKQPEYNVLFASGISVPDDLRELGTQTGVLTKRGSHLYFEDTSVGNGRAEFVRRMHEDPALAQRIRSAILERSGVV